MSKSAVEMEDAKKLSNDSGNNIQESKSKVFDAKVESEGEKFPCAAAVSGDVNDRDNGAEDLNKCRNQDKDKTKLETEVKDQPIPKSEANEPTQGSVCGVINTNSENGEQINTETGAEEQRPPLSAVEKQTDTKNEVVEQKATNGGVKGDKSTENGMEGGNHGENVEKRPSEDFAEKKPKEIGKADTDYAVHVAGGETTMGNADAGDDPRGNRQLPTELSANTDPHRQDAELDEVPRGGDVEMEDAVNFDKDKTLKEQGAGTVLASHETDGNDKIVETAAKHDGEESSLANQHEAATPNSLVRCSSAKAADHSGETAKTVFTQATLLVINIMLEREHKQNYKIECRFQAMTIANFQC